MSKRRKIETAETPCSRETTLEILQNLRQQYGETAERLNQENEATVRLVIINQILKALGWAESDFHPETPIKGEPGYIDYLLAIDERPQFIVEAKKRGITFSHPQQGQLKKTEYELKYIRSAFGQVIGPVIEQATRYSRATGVPYSVITNGAEWLLIQTIAQGKQSIESLKCVYFGNLLAEVSDFNHFWELLAKPNVDQGSLERYFSELNSPFSEFCKTPRDELGEPKWLPHAVPNTHLREFYDRFLDEMTDSPSRVMLEHCFVTNTTLDQYQGDLKRFLRDTAPEYIADAIDITPGDGKDILSRDQKGRVILITGSVGSGKSTFITKVLVEAKKDGRFENITIDLIDEVEGDPDRFNDYLWDEVAKGWKKTESGAYSNETLRRVFWRELKEFRESPRGIALQDNRSQLSLKEADLLEKLSHSPRDFLGKSWRNYAKQSQKGIVVFLDNVDRASESYQRLVYAFAHKLARETGATVMITMREVTYFRGRKSGFLDVRSSDKAYHLQTPDVIQIIKKRLRYAEVQLELEQPLQEERKPDFRLKGWRSNADWEAFRQSAQTFIHVLKTSLLASPNSQKLTSLLSSIAWHDVRYFLERLRTVHFMIGDTSEEWSVSEVITALMLSTQEIGNQAPLPNLFLPPHERYPCYFLKERILLMLLYGKRQSEILQGTHLKVLLSFARKYGYQERWVRQAINEMVRERLLECVEIPAAAEYTKNYELDESDLFRASPLAVTLLEYVQFDPAYLSLVGNELPFHEEDAYQALVSQIRDTISLLVEEGIDRTAVHFLVETDAPSLVARYLVQCFSQEPPLVAENFYPPEIAATEAKLQLLLKRLQEMIPVAEKAAASSPKKSRKKPATADQLTLDIVPTIDLSPSIVSISIPAKLREGHSKQTDHLEKIFWALVQLKSQGELAVTGSEVTKIINLHLVDDLHRVEATNISRSLRGATLQAQSWLVTTKIAERKKLYRLAENWLEVWQTLFNEPPPLLN